MKEFLKECFSFFVDTCFIIATLVFVFVVWCHIARAWLGAGSLTIHFQ